MSKEKMEQTMYSVNILKIFSPYKPAEYKAPTRIDQILKKLHTVIIEVI